MGVTSSSSKGIADELNMRSDQFPWEKIVYTNLEDRPEKQRVYFRATVEAAVDGLWRELYALLPPKVGESSTDQPKEGDTERDDELLVERFCEFMKGGDCKESFKTLEDCVKESGSVLKCTKHLPMLIKCVDAHSDYYKPIIALGESTVKQLAKDVEAFVLSQKEPAARDD
ncbi:unnamed protein product [Arabidopsis halleri]